MSEILGIKPCSCLGVQNLAVARWPVPVIRAFENEDSGHDYIQISEMILYQCSGCKSIWTSLGTVPETDLEVASV